MQRENKRKNDRRWVTLMFLANIGVSMLWRDSGEFAEESLNFFMGMKKFSLTIVGHFKCARKEHGIFKVQVS